MLVYLLIDGAMVLINNRQHFSSVFSLTLLQLGTAVRITVEFYVGKDPLEKAA